MFDAYGRCIAIADLAWPSRRLLVEADGTAYHSGGPRRRYDRRRQNAIVAADGRWQMLRFDWSDCITTGYVGTALRDVLDPVRA